VSTADHAEELGCCTVRCGNIAAAKNFAVNIIPKSSRKDDELASAMSETGVIAMCMWSGVSKTKPPVYGRYGRQFPQYDTHVKYLKIKPSANTLKQIVRFARDKDGAVINLGTTTLFKSKEFWDTLGADQPVQNTQYMYAIFATSDKQGLEALARNAKRRNGCLFTGLIGTAIWLGLVCIIVALCCCTPYMYHKDLTDWEDLNTGAIQEGEEVV
jgi:hypothetical protein